MTDDARESLVAWCQELHRRGLCPGTSGNVSVRDGQGWLCTPTGGALGDVRADALAAIGADGAPDGDARPTKEWGLHLALYRARPEVQAIVHLHSRHAAAVSCRADLDPADTIPKLTAYYAMHVDTLPLVAWHPPGDPLLAAAVGRAAGASRTLLLANHGPVVGAASLAAAVRTAEEIEEAAALWLTLEGRPIRPLDPDQLARLAAAEAARRKSAP